MNRGILVAVFVTSLLIGIALLAPRTRVQKHACEELRWLHDAPPARCKEYWKTYKKALWQK